VPSLLRFACGLAALSLVWSDDMSSQYDRTAYQMSELLMIREQMQSVYSPFVGSAANHQSEVRDLGDTIENQPAELKQGRTYALLQLNRAIDDSAHPDRPEELGESRHPSGQKHAPVDSTRLNSLLDVPQNGDITEAVNRLTYFLKKQRAEHKTLSREQLDAVRQFYIDQTADTLARYGFEDSPYGEHDVSIRRGDAVAARRHMDKEDQLMHTRGKTGGATDGNIEEVIKNLKETANLSDFLDRLTQDIRQVEDIPVKPEEPEDDSTMSQLAALQSDEESITSGIEKLLSSIKSGQPMKMEDAMKEGKPKHQPKGSLQERAETESSRLSKLERELRAQNAAFESHKTKKSTKKVVRVPLPKLQKRLDGVISEELDKTLRRFRMMRSSGASVDPALRAKIEQYMSLITANLLHACVSYEQWNQQHALQDETKAVRKGDAGLLSRYHTGTHLSSHKVVQQFIRDQLASPVRQPAVPWKLQSMMQHGVTLPGVGNMVITLKKP